MSSRKEKQSVRTEIVGLYESLASASRREKQGLRGQISSLYRKLGEKGREEVKTIDEDTTKSLSKVKDVLESEDFTMFNLKSLNQSIAKIEEVEDSLQDNELYQEVIGLYEQAIDRLSNNVTTDSIDGGGLFDALNCKCEED